MTDSTQEEIIKIKARLAEGDAEMIALKEMLQEQRKAIEENTSLTKEVKDIVELGKAFFKLAKYLGIVAKWLSYIGAGWAVIWTFINHPFGGK